MNKEELIAAVAQKSQLSKSQTEKVVNTLFEVITSSLAEGKKIQIIGFGAFEVKERSERMGRNPKTGEEILIAASKNPVFMPGKILKDIVNHKSFIDGFIKSGKINEKETEILKYVCSESDSGNFSELEIKEIAKELNMDIENIEIIIDSLISKKILDTMVYYGPIDSVYLRSRYRKYL